eukprot:1081523-Pleurochrysis_carterae.AAC.4
MECTAGAENESTSKKWNTTASPAPDAHKAGGHTEMRASIRPVVWKCRSKQLRAALYSPRALCVCPSAMSDDIATLNHPPARGWKVGNDRTGSCHDMHRWYTLK